MFQKIAILGPGLLGSSLALAIRHRQLAKTIALWSRREEIIPQLQERKIGDLATTQLQKAIDKADFIIFATPVRVMGTLAEVCLPFLGKNVLVTDVGSVKTSVVNGLEEIFQDKAYFIGSHPMAGSDKTGFEHAQVNLFEQAACFITPTEQSQKEAQLRITEFWQKLGCRIKVLPPYEHDYLVAGISHLPHLLASLLVNSVVDFHTIDALQWIGGGFRDSTRVALGSPWMWNDILAQNREALLKAIQNFRQHLNEAERALQENRPLQFLLEHAAQARAKISK